MGSIIGKVTDAVGLTDNKGARRAARSSAEADAMAIELNREQVALMKEQLQFQKDQYEDWENIYGPIQDNLSEYYQNLDGESLTALGLQNQQREYQAAVKLMKEEAAQRGIEGSGIEYAGINAATMENARARATIRTEAPMKTAQEKMNFLSLGMGQYGQVMQGIGNAYGNVGNAYNAGIQSRSNAAGNYLQQYNTLKSQSMDTMGDIVGMGMRVGFGG